MRFKKISNKKEYLLSIDRFEKIFQAKKGSKESDDADVLSMLIKDYEDTHYVINAPSPLEAIKYRMEQQGLTNKDLAKIIGHKSRVSDIFHKTRKLNLEMIRNLHLKLHIPLETLLQAY